MKAPFLTGSRIYLRALGREDAPRLVPWLNDHDVIHTLATYRPIALHAEEEFIANAYRSSHDLPLAIVVSETDQLIGVTGLHQMDFRDRHATFGIFIGEKREWGKGYGTEATALMVAHAFETLNLNRVWLRVFEYNTRGIKAYEKVGFRREGVLRQDHYAEGRYWDTSIMAILKEDWLARTR